VHYNLHQRVWAEPGGLTFLERESEYLRTLQHITALSADQSANVVFVKNRQTVMVEYARFISASIVFVLQLYCRPQQLRLAACVELLPVAAC